MFGIWNKRNMKHEFDMNMKHELHDSSQLFYMELDSWRPKSCQHSIQNHTHSSLKARIRFDHLLAKMAKQGGVFIYSKVH